MKNRTKLLVTGAAVVALSAAGTGAALSSNHDDDDGADVPITGMELERASAAALESTGGGTVTETEVGDEESYYEVEVTQADGTQVDVQLDEQFNVVDVTPDDDGAGDVD